MRPPAKCHPNRRHAAFGLCPVCYMRKRSEEEPEYRKKKAAYKRKSRLKNIEGNKKYQKKYRKANPDIFKNSQLKHYYGITLSDYQTLLEKQNWRCAICNEIAKLSVDHSHMDLTTRGLLCLNCNLGLGHFKDNPHILKLARKYLESRWPIKEKKEEIDANKRDCIDTSTCNGSCDRDGVCDCGLRSTIRV